MSPHTYVSSALRLAAILLVGVVVSALATSVVNQSTCDGYEPFPLLPTQLETPASDRVLVPGEELVYKVSYLFIGLGEIRTKVLDRFVENGIVHYKVAAYIDSYPGLPFVNLHSTMISIIDTAYHSQWFESKELDRGEWKYIRYDNLDNGKSIHIRIWRGNETWFDSTIATNGYYEDGLSLLYFARGIVHRRGVVNVLTLAGQYSGMTSIRLRGKTTTVKIDAVSHRINTIYFDGNASFIGIFGLTGDFEGWFSNDDACVPITANLHVLIGSIRVELKEWKRPGWNPPRG
ncbi:MAG: DUF3108 domain-containing protein [Bacteroidota bacterium]